MENNHYFPAESIKKKYFTHSNTHTRCPWKGRASYYNNIKVAEEENKDAAWYYPEVSKLATPIEGRIAFWKGVSVQE